MGTLVNLRPQLAPAELDLIDACRRGDRDALSQVFAAHAPYVERLLRRIVGSRLEVEDLMQTTFVAAIRAFPRFRGEAQVRTWLARIAIRTAHERLRSTERRYRDEHAGIDDWSDHKAPPALAEQDLDTRRQLERLHLHLAAIGGKKRIALVLHVFEGLPLEEVAALTGAGLAATKSRVFWARRDLLKRAQRDPLLRDRIRSKRGGLS